MSEALTTLVANIRPYLSGCPDFVINPEVVKAYIEFCRQTRLLTKDLTFDIATTDVDDADNDKITVDTSTAMADHRPVAITKLFVDTAPYAPIKREVLTDATYLDNNVLPNKTRLYNFPTDETIDIFPFTDLDADFELYLTVAFQPHTDITTMPDELYDEWHETIEAGALAKLFKLPNREWTDRAEAERNRIDFWKGIMDARGQQGIREGKTRVQMRQFV